MDPKLEQIFWTTFPDIFEEKDLPPTETNICWGFDIGDGWSFLLWNLCKRIKAFQWFHDCRVIATQVKEKYGMLYFYYRVKFPNRTEVGKKRDIYTQISRLIFRYGKISATVCEVCGKPAKSTVRNGWIYTRCKNCLKKRPY